MNYWYIDSAENLSRHLNGLRNARIDTVALDLEGESNLHQYGEMLCLIQMYDGKDAAIIDPFKTSMKPIKKFLEDRSIMKIMYDAAGDRAFLFKNCGIDLKSILDLQPAVSLLNFEKRDLSSVLTTTLKMDARKSKKKFQRHNWTRRPISSAAIEYAIEDVIYLFELKDRLLSEIIKSGLLDQFILKNLQVQNKPHIYNSQPKLFQSRRYINLTDREKRVFERLFEVRDRYAKIINYPPNSVLANDLLFELTTANITVREVGFTEKIPLKIKNGIIEDLKKAIK